MRINCFILLTLTSLLLALKPSHASSASEPEAKTDQIETIETELLREKKQFLKFGFKEKGLLEQLANLEKEIAGKRRLLKELKEEIQINKTELRKRQERLSQLEQSAKAVRERLAKRLVAFYKYAKRGYVQLFATSRDLDQLRKGIQYLRIIMDEDQQLLRQMREVRQKYDQEISSIKEKLAVINSMEKEENSRLSSMEENIEKKVILLMKIHKEKEFYETAVKELQLAAIDLKETLLNLDRKQEMKKPLPSGFATSKGKLILPFRGKILKKNNPLSAKTRHTHKGIYIEGPLGEKVRAIFPGRVDFSGWLKGYGQIIVVNHGSRFFTVSAHLSRRNKEEGDMVEKGDVIGLLGQTGSLEGPRLYFEIRRAGTNLDPLKWLKGD